MMLRTPLILVLMLMLGACTYTGQRQPAQTAAVKPVPKFEAEKPKCHFLSKGLASWYGHELAGNKTANGEKFKPDGISAAHRTLPFGTVLHVTLDDLSRGGNPEGVYVRVNDRGPFKKGRIIDLSWGAAKELGMMDTQRVHVYKCADPEPAGQS